MKYQTIKSLSKEYSISIFTFRKFIKMGLPHYRLGRKILINPEEFEEWFKRYKFVRPRSNLDKFVDDVMSKMS